MIDLMKSVRVNDNVALDMTDDRRLILRLSERSKFNGSDSRLKEYLPIELTPEETNRLRQFLNGGRDSTYNTYYP